MISKKGGDKLKMKITITYLTFYSFFPISDVFTSRVSFRIVNEKFKDDLLDPDSSSYSDLQIAVVRKVSLFVSFLVKQ